MSMYSMLMGLHPLAPIITSVLGIKPNGDLDAGRIRDAGLIEVEGEIRFELLTRNGEGAWIDDANTPNEALRKHQLYARDYDDSSDRTYKVFEFRVPDEHKEAVKEAWEALHPSWKLPAMKRFRNVIESLGNEPEKVAQMAKEMDKHVEVMVVSPGKPEVVESEPDIKERL